MSRACIFHAFRAHGINEPIMTLLIELYLEGFAHSAAAEGLDAGRDNGSASVRVLV